jgi:cytochrome P450
LSDASSMSAADTLERGHIPAMPPRPAQPLRGLRLLRAAQDNSLTACDEELFDELIVERRLLGRPFFVISDPDGIRRVMQDNYDNYPRLGWIRRVFEFAAGSGMLHAEGDPWRWHRRLINPVLDPRAMAAEVPMLITIAEEMAQVVAQMPADKPIDLHDAFRHLVTRSSGQIFTGDDREIDRMIDRMGQYPGRYGLVDVLPVPPWLRTIDGYRKTRQATREFQPMLDRLIAERRRDDFSGHKDLVWRLVNARDRDTGEGLSADELYDELLTLGATSATSLRPLPWFWYLLATHPWAEARLHAELEGVLGDRAPTDDDLPKFVYLRQVLDETMRLYPPLPIMMMRVAEAEDTVCGRRIPRNSIIAIIPWVVHRHRRLWSDPDRFDPERFTADQTAARSRYSYLPFAVGPHVCVGAWMATLQLVTAVAVFARRFRFRLVPGRTVEPTAWTNIRPRYGMWMTAEPRLAMPSRAA